MFPELIYLSQRTTRHRARHSVERPIVDTHLVKHPAWMARSRPGRDRCRARTASVAIVRAQQKETKRNTGEPHGLSEVD